MAPPAVSAATPNDSATATSNLDCEFIIQAHGKEPILRSLYEIGWLSFYLAGEDVCGILESERPDAAQAVRGSGTLDSGSIEKAKQVLAPTTAPNTPPAVHFHHPFS